MSKRVSINGRLFQQLLSEEEIQTRIRQLSQEIGEQYQGKKVAFLVVLSGAFRFASDLIKHFNGPVQIYFCTVKSYVGIQNKAPKLVLPITERLTDYHLIIIEDIVDSGTTLSFLRKQPEIAQCKSLKVASLLFKPEAFQGLNPPEFVGFRIKNEFVVGYGLDMDENARELNHIYQLES